MDKSVKDGERGLSSGFTHFHIGNNQNKTKKKQRRVKCWAVRSHVESERQVNFGPSVNRSKREKKKKKKKRSSLYNMILKWFESKMSCLGNRRRKKRRKKKKENERTRLIKQLFGPLNVIATDADGDSTLENGWRCLTESSTQFGIVDRTSNDYVITGIYRWVHLVTSERERERRREQRFRIWLVKRWWQKRTMTCNDERDWVICEPIAKKVIVRDKWRRKKWSLYCDLKRNKRQFSE